MQQRALSGRFHRYVASITTCNHRRYYASLYKRRPCGQMQRRQWVCFPKEQNRARRLSTLAAIFMPPAVFCALVVSLWAYKCLMMVAFQNKIIYMPSVPPFSRSEQISDYAASCSPITWRSESIRSLDGTRLSLAIGENVTMQQQHQSSISNPSRGHSLTIVYFQGNASSFPPRMPGLSSVLKQLDASDSPIACTVVALSYRGFWTSSGRASQAGIERDAAATMNWVHEMRNGHSPETKLVLWGQSIGAGVATTAAANWLSLSGGKAQGEGLQSNNTYQINGLLLETPFTSVENMLISLYPQRWLPYRYLGPFLWNHWNSLKALRTIRARQEEKMPVLIATAGKDEVVPSDQGEDLVSLCKDLGFDMRHCVVSDALHTEVLAKSQGRKAIVDFLRAI